MMENTPLLQNYKYPSSHRFLNLEKCEYDDLYNEVWKILHGVDFGVIDTYEVFDATIQFLTKAVMIKTLANTYKIPKAQMRRAIMTMVKVLNILGTRDIIINKHLWMEIESEYKNIFKFPNCVGALGAIRRKVKTGRKILFMHLKETITIFAVADCRQRIILAETMLGPRKSFVDSVLYERMVDDELNIPPTSRLTCSDIVAPKIFVAGENFPQLFNVCVPYPRARAEFDFETKVYNKEVDAARVNVDIAFYNLEKMFKIFKYLSMVNYREADNIVHACINLYNYRINLKGRNCYSFFKDLVYINVANGKEDVEEGETVREIYKEYFFARFGKFFHTTDSQLLQGFDNS